MTKNKRTKRIVQIALNVVLYVFLAICVVSVLVTVASKKEVDGTAELFGYKARTVICGKCNRDFYSFSHKIFQHSQLSPNLGEQTNVSGSSFCSSAMALLPVQCMM